MNKNLWKDTSKCPKCKTEPALKNHKCAYRCEIYGDPNELCRCCSTCLAKCAEEV